MLFPYRVRPSVHFHLDADKLHTTLQQNTQHAELSHIEFVGLLVQDEKAYRDNLRLKRLLSKAKLRQEAAMEDIDYGASRGLSQQVILELA